MGYIKFEKLTEDNINLVKEWFDDPETIKYISGPNWINNALERPSLAIGNEFRGSKVLNRQGYVVFDQDKPIAYIEIETYDKYNRVRDLDNSNHPIITETINLPTASFIYTVNPFERGKGYGIKVLNAMLDTKEFLNIKIFAATTDVGNIISEKALAKAGFLKLNSSPNFEDVYEWVYKR